MKGAVYIKRAVLVAAMFLLAAVPVTTALAARSDYCNGSILGGRVQCYGYFENKDAYVGGIFFDDVIEGGFNVTNVDTLAEFIQFYNNKLFSGTYNDRMGAAFTVLTMLGVTGPNAGGSVGAGITMAQSRFNEWRNIVNGYDGTNGYGINFYSSYAAPAGYTNSARSLNTDDIVYHYKGAETVSVVRFYTPSGTAARIERKCANMIGATSLPTPPPPISWTVTPKSTVSATEVLPGETVDFKHYVKNNGPDTASGVDYEVEQRTNGVVSGYKAMTGPIAAMASGDEPNVTNDTYTPTQADVGKVYCRRTNAEPSAYGGSITANGAWACVTVKSNYDLFPQTPQAGGTPQPLMVGNTLSATDIDGYVWNNGATADRDIPYEIHQFVVTGASKPVFDNTKFPLSTAVGATTVIYAQGSHNNGAACSSWMKTSFPMITCNAAPLATGTSKFPGGQSPALPGFKDINADDYKPGDWICQFLSVGLYRYNINDPQAHRIGVPMCMVIAKQPALQIWGSDARVGNGIISKNDDSSVLTSTFASGGATFGSWAEYGIFAPRNATNTLGKIESVSGGAISGTAGLTTPPSASHLSKLSFANTNSPYGRWAPAQLVASIKQAVQVQAYPVLDAPGASINVWTDNLTSKGKLTVAKLSHTDGSGNPAKVSIRGVNAGGTKLSLPDGGSLLMYSDESVSIDSDIILTEQTITELGQASQVIVIAKNIIISSAVKQLDAWLVAIPAADGTGGTITTCDSIADTSAGLYYFNGLKLGDDCEDNQLRINGAVIAKELQLRRSFGADKIAGISQPAEIINLRPDAYMWGMLPTSTPANAGLPIRTMITTELPPRF